MKTISVHLPDSLEADLAAYADDEQVDRSVAVRNLLADELDKWRREKAIARLCDGEVTFGRAAEMAEMSVWNFADLVAQHDVAWVSKGHLESDLAALDETK